MRSCGPSRRTRCSGRRSPRCSSSTARSSGTTSGTVFDRASRVVPRLRQRVSSSPLSVAPPRWEIDANFDLGYHLRFTARRRARVSWPTCWTWPRPIAMQGFDRARPLWECTIVEGLADGRAPSSSRSTTRSPTAIGGVNLLLELFDLDPEAPRARHARGPAGRCHASPDRLRRLPQPRAPASDRHPEPPGQRCRDRGSPGRGTIPSARSTRRPSWSPRPDGS